MISNELKKQDKGQNIIKIPTSGFNPLILKQLKDNGFKGVKATTYWYALQELSNEFIINCCSF